jgi:signal peptidase II
MFYLIIIIWVILDLFTKNLAYKYLQNQVKILWDFLSFKYVENTWIAFSTQIPWLKYLTVLLIIWIFYYYLLEKKQEKNNYLLDFSFWLILAWAIWDWIERIFNWYVVDFIAVKHFSVFNLADSFITIWAILYLYMIFKNKKFNT